MIENMIEEDFIENLNDMVFDTIDDSLWINEFNKSKMKCVLRHFFETYNLSGFYDYDLNDEEFERYYRNHYIKYTSELDYEILKEYIKNDS